jgi:ABC-type sugar transport system substrate-binding protein
LSGIGYLRKPNLHNDYSESPNSLGFTSKGKNMASIKRTASVVALSTAAVLTAAAVPAATHAAGQKTIAFVMGAASDPFFKAMKVGADAEAKAKGVKLIWQGDPSVYSPATQIPIADAVLAQKPDGLVLIPTDPTALQAEVTKAKAASIPVVNVDTHVGDLTDVAAFITGDNTDGGTKAAQALAKAIRYKAGKKYQVAVGLTSATATTNVARLEGFKAEVAKSFPGITIVDVEYSQSQPAVANTNVNNWLTKYPHLSGIFAIDGTNAAGAAAAIQAKGLIGKVSLVGYDAYPTNVKLISKHVISALIAQDPAAEAKLAIDDLVAIFNGQGASVQKTVVIPNVTLDINTSAADKKKFTYVA